MNDRELMQMALQALQESKPIDINDPTAFYRSAHAIEALRVALAQPEPEPVAWKDAPSKIYLQVCEENDCSQPFDSHIEVSWCQDKINDSDISYVRADIASPQREWVGLTEGETIDLALSAFELPEVSSETREKIHRDLVIAMNDQDSRLMLFAANIEAKLKEKNT
jgi:hypothetical protein